MVGTSPTMTERVVFMGSGLALRASPERQVAPYPAAPSRISL
jgi:hypothetical protein